MITTISKPAVLLDALDDKLRQQLRLEPDEDDQNSLIDGLCLAAVRLAEGYTKRRFITQTVRLTRDCFGFGGIPLPVDPIQGVDQVVYTDGAGVDQTLAPSGYRLIPAGLPVELHPPYGESWPVPRPDKGAVRIDLVVGFGDTAYDVPEDIVQAIRLMVNWWFLAGRDAGHDIPGQVKAMLNPWRLWL
ncbi:hypothetical protein [Mameliella sp. MMSF_3455]|uniref:head-tail connector protein n=1 Tax=Mameliella sp. MMSF_3455 TaxID=3046714 RepID=UPI00273E20F8|nr:hypothetical protein [Mameliella sp. MMSF_3455]